MSPFAHVVGAGETAFQFPAAILCFQVMSDEPMTTKLPQANQQRAASRDVSSLSDPRTWPEQHGNYLFRYALIRVRNEAVAEDLVQDALLAVFQVQSRFSGESSEQSWLTGILKHKV